MPYPSLYDTWATPDGLVDGEIIIGSSSSDELYLSGGGSNRSITGMSIWDTPEVRTDDVERGLSWGVSPGAEALGGRKVTVAGWIKATSVDTATTSRNAIAKAFAPSTTMKALVWRWGTDIRVVYGRVRGASFDNRMLYQAKAVKWEARFLATDPRIYNWYLGATDEDRTASTSWTVGAENSLVLPNGGNAPSPWRVKFLPAVSKAINNPVIYADDGAHTTPPYKLDLSGSGGITVTNPDYIIWDAADQSVYAVNGSTGAITSLRKYLTYDSTWWELPPGGYSMGVGGYGATNSGTFSGWSKDAYY